MNQKASNLIAAAFGATIFIATTAQASTFTTLYQFQGGTDGSVPDSGVVQDAAGVLYGETRQAGTTDCVTRFTNPVLGCGTVYSFSPAGGIKTLVLFNGANGALGQNRPLVAGSTLYGTAGGGGTNDKGVVFSVQTDGTGFKLLHSFNGTDGNQPYGSVVVDKSGNIFGVTIVGGPAYPALGYGVLYEIASNGTFTVLHNFANGPDGANPTSLVIKKNGTLIGGATAGGYKKGACIFVGCGTLFEYVPSTATFTILQTFNDDDGGSPVVGSVAKNGTVLGSAGAFFTLSSSGKYKFLPPTQGGLEAGNGIVAPVLSLGPSLALTHPTGEFGGDGTLFQQVGTIQTILHGFSGPDGAGPDSTPVLTPAGSFIGTASVGGAPCSCGTIYEYVP